MMSYKQQSEMIKLQDQIIRTQLEQLHLKEGVIDKTQAMVADLKAQVKKYAPIERATRNNLPKDAVGIMVAGRNLGSSGPKLAKALRDIGAFKYRGRTNHARPEYIEAGYFRKQGAQTFITAAGMNWIRGLINREEIRI